MPAFFKSPRFLLTAAASATDFLLMTHYASQFKKFILSACPSNWLAYCG
jgi:hypothetical protein